MRKWNINMMIGGGMIALLLLILIVSFFYTPYDVNEMNTSERFASPSAKYWLGTDNFGRDIFSRIMQGTQTAFLVGLIAISIGAIGGTIIGALAGYVGGWTDELLMRVMDAMSAFPGILFALMFITVFGPGTVNTMIALGIMAIPNFARISRSGFLQYKEQEFVMAAKAIGLPPLAIMFRHILPNALSPLIVAASLGFASAVLAEAGLSYLGLGVQPPDPSWGRMLNEAQSYAFKAPWYTLAPGMMIILAVLGFNLLGDGLRDFRDPKHKNR